MIGSGKGIDHGEGQAILGENEGSSHKTSLNLVPIELPSNEKIRKFAIETSSQSVGCSDGV